MMAIRKSGARLSPTHRPHSSYSIQDGGRTVNWGVIKGIPGEKVIADRASPSTHFDPHLIRSLSQRTKVALTRGGSLSRSSER